jgi:glutamine---fructose-6-phosphate transaminase (isomerizing)
MFLLRGALLTSPTELAVAAEMALKFKAVCGIQAEAFSAAEVKHGPTAMAQHPVLDALCAVQSFYLMVEALARARGHDPDQPPRLKKVTLTQ